MISKTCCKSVYGQTKQDKGTNATAVDVSTTTYLIIGELYTGNHENATVAGLPVIIADKRTLASGAFAFGNAGHAEADTLRLVEGSRVQDCDAIPARLDLDREVLFEAHVRGTIMEYGLKRRIFEGGTVYVTGYPVVVEYGRTLGATISNK
jgi:hypothetical protein